MARCKDLLTMQVSSHWIIACIFAVGAAIQIAMTWSIAIWNFYSINFVVLSLDFLRSQDEYSIVYNQKKISAAKEMIEYSSDRKEAILKVRNQVF